MSRIREKTHAFLDLDGTLHLPHSGQTNTILNVINFLRAKGLPGTEHYLAKKLHQAMNNGTMMHPRNTYVSFIDRVTQNGHSFNEEEKQEFVDYGVEKHFSYETANRRLVDGLEETLEALKSKGLRLLIVTKGNWKYQTMKIEDLRLEPFFDGRSIDEFMVAEEEMFKTKPYYPIWYRALKQERVLPGNVIGVGDKWVDDVLGMKLAGITTIIKLDQGKHGMVSMEEKLEKGHALLDNYSEDLRPSLLKPYNHNTPLTLKDAPDFLYP
ncbi:HAD hydrolase-like protein [Candidatus Woesearchaeota archaeon]|nr:HAD hydrolase-like protein [Candidatus Woesearchaeota archaeon]